MKKILNAMLAVSVLCTTSMAMANSCQSMARDLYSAQGYQQRCAYQLKQTATLSAQFKEQKCDTQLSGAEKNKLLNEVNQQLNQSFNQSKKESCDLGKNKYN